MERVLAWMQGNGKFGTRLQALRIKVHDKSELNRNYLPEFSSTSFYLILEQQVRTLH